MLQNPVAGATRDLGLGLIGALWRERPCQNLLVAPTALMGALALLANGAAGATQAGILQAMGLPGVGLTSLNQGFAALLRSLAKDRTRPSIHWTRPPPEPLTLELANGLWGSALDFSPDYIRRCREVYGAEVSALDFAAPQAAEQIRAWVSRKTRGKIPDAVRDLDPALALVLVSAILFRGAWVFPFDPPQTRLAPFHLLDGTTRPVPMMRMVQREDFLYASNPHFAIIRLPFEPGAICLDILLPHALSDPARLLGALRPEVLRIVQQKLAKRYGSICLPRCTVRCEAELAGALCTLGMAAAFDPQRADLSAMLARSHEGLVVSSARHQTLLELDEHGATAAGSVEMGIDLGFREDQPFAMVVDRPFACVIHDTRTGAVLFLGVVVDPPA